MESSCMYMWLLDMANELCEFLSNIKHPENEFSKFYGIITSQGMSSSFGTQPSCF